MSACRPSTASSSGSRRRSPSARAGCTSWSTPSTCSTPTCPSGPTPGTSARPGTGWPATRRPNLAAVRQHRLQLHRPPERGLQPPHPEVRRPLRVLSGPSTRRSTRARPGPSRDGLFFFAPQRYRDPPAAVPLRISPLAPRPPGTSRPVPPLRGSPLHGRGSSRRHPSRPRWGIPDPSLVAEVGLEGPALLLSETRRCRPASSPWPASSVSSSGAGSWRSAALLRSLSQTAASILSVRMRRARYRLRDCDRSCWHLTSVPVGTCLR